jgi:ferredoxin-NADP reductase
VLELRDQSGVRTLAADQVSRPAVGVVSLRLADVLGEELPAWEPGAHLEVVLPSGLVRQYSLHGDPRDRTAYDIAVLLEPDGRGGSQELHDAAAAGLRLAVRGPRNHFPLVDAAHHLLVAGGIGITPILAMARELARTGASWSALYGGRSLATMAFAGDLVALDPARVTLVPQDAAGLIDLPAALRTAPPGTVVYCCGPAPLLDAVAAACAASDVVRSLQVERFAAVPDVLDPPVDHPGAATTFEVVLQQTGCTVTVGPEDSILDRVQEVVPAWPSSCREGYCGTCETRVLEGTPDHRDVVLTDEEREAGATMMICVGRSRTPRLVLDI